MSDFTEKYKSSLDELEISENFKERTMKKMIELRDMPFKRKTSRNTIIRTITTTAAAAACLAVLFAAGRTGMTPADIGLTAVTETSATVATEITEGLRMERRNISEETAVVSIESTVPTQNTSQETFAAAETCPILTTERTTSEAPISPDHPVYDEFCDEVASFNEEKKIMTTQAVIPETETTHYPIMESFPLTKAFISAPEGDVTLTDEADAEGLLSLISAYTENKAFTTEKSINMTPTHSVRFTDNQGNALHIFTGEAAVCMEVIDSYDTFYYCYELSEAEYNELSAFLSAYI